MTPYFGEGNGNPLQYSCLENLMDTGAWQATVYGVARDRQELASKQLQRHTCDRKIHLPSGGKNAHFHINDDF